MDYQFIGVLSKLTWLSHGKILKTTVSCQTGLPSLICYRIQKTKNPPEYSERFMSCLTRTFYPCSFFCWFDSCVKLPKQRKWGR